jgi:hypothetical protein
MGQKITTDNRVLFHRVANTLNYLDIKTVIVSCGTCMDQLQKYEFEKIFPGCRLLDIHEYLMEKGLKLEGITGVRYMYHEPCHTPMKVHSGIKVANELMGTRVDLSDRCCGESGTLAVSRPDISTQVRFRKQEEIEKGAEKLRGADAATPVKILTSCPSCLQGLSRYSGDAGGVDADYIVVEMAKHILGDNWLSEYVARPTRAASSACCCKPPSVVRKSTKARMLRALVLFAGSDGVQYHITLPLLVRSGYPSSRRRRHPSRRRSWCGRAPPPGASRPPWRRIPGCPGCPR